MEKDRKRSVKLYRDAQQVCMCARPTVSLLCLSAPTSVHSNAHLSTCLQGYFGNYAATGGGYPELSAREDSEDLWHDWGRCRAGDLPRNPGGGATPLKSRSPLPSPSSTNSNGALQPNAPQILPWALEPESGRIRRGRSVGLHGRFVVGGKALPWIHTVSGFVSDLVAEGPSPKNKDKGDEGAVAIVGAGQTTENTVAVNNNENNHRGSSSGGGGRLRCQLQSLELAQCDKVGSSVIQVLAECAAGSLTRLDIRNLDDLSPASATLGWLAQCKRLQEVQGCGEGKRGEKKYGKNFLSSIPNYNSPKR